MMKTRINLFSASLLPPKLRLTFARLSVSLLALVGLSLLMAGYHMWSTQIVMSQINASQALANGLNSQKQQLEQALAARKPSQALLAQVELMELRILLKRQLKGELLQRSAVVNRGYAQLLTELAQASDRNIWLSGIQVTGQVFEFEGFSLTPESIPQWIDRLKLSQTLKGYGFSSMTLASGDGGPLAFKLNSKPVEMMNGGVK